MSSTLQSNQPAAAGFCPTCRILHSLPEGNSRRAAIELMHQLEKNGCIDDGRRPEFSTEILYSEARGQMFGVLECRDSEDRTIILKAFSGQYNGHWLVDGWVPPIPDPAAFARLSDPVDRQIKQLDREIQTRNVDDPETARLKQQRKTLSQNLMKELHALYQLTNFKSETRALTDVFQGRGIPTGTGDCCAPKLLNAAARQGLHPVGLSEFYFGRENRFGTRHHGHFYPACTEKCRPILGFMLCGSDTSPTTHTNLHESDSEKNCRVKTFSGLHILQQIKNRRMNKIYESREPEVCSFVNFIHSLVRFFDCSSSSQGSFAKTSGQKTSFEIEILHDDPEFVVVNKPSGLPAVPGKAPELQDCVTARIKQLFPDCIEQPAVHRLDMDTSGLMVVALNETSHRELSRQFHDREVKKRYIALLDGNPNEDAGTIRLPFRLDVNNRPRQIYDPVQGKLGITHWKKLSVENGRARIEFRPVTGRTHQLRVHSASKHGLGIPIAGDRLYGNGTAPGQLKLHASFLSFRHPRTKQTMRFKSEPGF